MSEPLEALTNPMVAPVHTFRISTEIGRSSILTFPRFLIEKSGSGRFGSIIAGDFQQIAGDRGKYLQFNAKLYQEDYSCRVRIKLDAPLTIEIFSDSGSNAVFNSRLEDYLILSLQIFEESIRAKTVYLAFVPGSEGTSKLSSGGRISERILRGNMINLFLLSILLGAVVLVVFTAFGLEWVAPVFLLLLMLSIVLSAGKILALRSDWQITERNQEVILIEWRNESDVDKQLFSRYEPALKQVKKRVYDMITNERKDLSPQELADLFNESGIPAQIDQIIVKRINVFEIVKRAAARFSMPVPSVAITKNPKPNAAATGFTKHLATMLITIGLLVQLEKDEIELVVGHELSHLKSGDPATLFIFVSIEYLLRVNVFLPYVWLFQVGFFSIFYIIMVFWLIFFFGKFLEARADLEAALILRDPKTMANSLKKIGFRKLILDANFIEGRESTFGDWTAFDPHPPIGFRIRRLESLDLGDIPKHTFLKSVGDVFRGMSRSIRQ